HWRARNSAQSIRSAFDHRRIAMTRFELHSASMAVRARMSTLALIVVAIAFTVIGIWFAQREEAQKEDALDAQLLAADEQVERTPAAPLASIEPSPQREPASEFPDARTSRPTATTAGPRSHGLVLDVGGAGIARF